MGGSGSRDDGFSGQSVQRLGLSGGAYITNFYDPMARLRGTLLRNSDDTTLGAALYGYNVGSQTTACTSRSSPI